MSDISPIVRAWWAPNGLVDSAVVFVERANGAKESLTSGVTHEFAGVLVKRLNSGRRTEVFR